jgi:hypothetical protein
MLVSCSKQAYANKHAVSEVRITLAIELEFMGFGFGIFPLITLVYIIVRRHRVLILAPHDYRCSYASFKTE